MRLELAILNNLVFSEDYLRKVIPFLNEDYFHNEAEKTVFNKINEFVVKHNACPTKDILLIEIKNDDNLNSSVYNEACDVVKELRHDDANKEWLIKETEKFCKDKSVYNAVLESIKIIDGESRDKDQGSIPELLTKALSVSFDTNIGHDYVEDSDARFDFYHEDLERIPFDIELLNRITKGGLPRKTLNILLAGTGVGKTLAMCHMAASNLLQGRNVLYITMEMAEMRISERIDANLLNIPINDLVKIDKETYEDKMEKLGFKVTGKLIIKEFPTATVGSAHFRHLLSELALKKNFVPDIIYIDYLNICISSRFKFGNNMNSYSYIKAIAEELRGLAVEKNVPVVSATQTNREGFDSSDIGLTNTSESFGLPMTADLMFAFITSEELKNLNQIQVKQLKNRYNDVNYYGRFNVGVEPKYMRLYNLSEDHAVEDIIDPDGREMKIDSERLDRLVFK